MKCSAYCTAKAYDTNQLMLYLNEIGMEPKYFDDVIYVEIDYKDKNDIDIFFFPFGCVTIWGADEVQEKSILEILKNVSINNLDTYITDFIDFKYNEESNKTFIDEEKNTIVLAEKSSFLKLSVSYALAQSIKLSLLEKSANNLLEKTSPFQYELANTGSVSLSKQEISKQIGILFNEKYSINLHSDILDTPEFFWRRPKYEPIYLMTAEFQDIQLRQNILNNRINIIHELYILLSNELNYKHSTRLEWIIITLITLEVIIGILHMIITK